MRINFRLRQTMTIVLGAWAFGHVLSSCRSGSAHDMESGLRDTTATTGSTTTPGSGAAGLPSACNKAVNYIVVGGVGYVGTAFGNQGDGQLEFKRFDPVTRELCEPPDAPNAAVWKFSGGYDGFTVNFADGKYLKFSPNKLVNYGYKSLKAPCELALRLFNATADSTGVPQGTISGSECEVRLDTEDRSWFGVTVRTPWNIADTGFDASADKDATDFLAQVLSSSQPTTLDKPLVPGANLNASIDPRVKDVMMMLHDRFQMTGRGARRAPDEVRHQERNTCLRNARATGWMEIQSHFYCILPYDYRTCYSGILVERVAGINSKPPLEQLKILMDAMHGAFDECFAPGKPLDFANDFGPDADLVAKAFQYTQFVKQGVMDFNIDEENQLIDDFYAKVGAFDSMTKERPTRLIEPEPWSRKQVRFTQAKQFQAARIKAAIAQRQGCAASGGTWPAGARTCACPATKPTFDQATNTCI